MSEPLLPDSPLEPDTGWAGKRTFLLAAVVCLFIPIAMVVATIMVEGTYGAAYNVLFIGAWIAVLSDFAFLIAGLAMMLRGKRSQGLGLIVGMIVGAVVGFGACMVPLGM